MAGRSKLMIQTIKLARDILSSLMPVPDHRIIARFVRAKTSATGGIGTRDWNKYNPLTPRKSTPGDTCGSNAFNSNTNCMAYTPYLANAKKSERINKPTG